MHRKIVGIRLFERDAADIQLAVHRAVHHASADQHHGDGERERPSRQEKRAHPAHAAYWLAQTMRASHSTSPVANRRCG